MAKDLTNNIFGHLKVIELDKTKSEKMLAKSYWLCQCDCANQTIKSIRADHLLNGDTISCGCEQKRKSGRKEINLLDQVFGRLTVIDRSQKIDNDGHIYWKCKCKCGNIIEVNGASLRRGDTKSCGCYKSEVLSNLYTELGKQRKSNLEGQKFNRLTVIKDTGKRQNNQILWLCLCECGNTTEVITGNLVSGHTASCGCIGKSKNEIIIQRMLKDNNIEYINQYSALNKFRFDFFVNNKYIIEYDGLQHFNYANNNGWNTKENFELTRQRDLIKNKYCFDNNIPIIRIPYDADYTIDDLKLETTRFLLTPENEQEYYSKRTIN